MKVDISRSPEQIKKNARVFRILFWFCLVFGILTIFFVPLGGVFFFVLSFISSRGRKNNLKLLADQEAAEAENAAAEAEEAARKAKAAAKAKEEEEREAAFLAAHELVKEIHTKAAGVTFRNSDGSSRQEMLSYCFDGDQLELRPFTYKGAPAYAIFDGGVQIGNIPAETAQVIHDQSDGLVIRAEIAEITGGDGLKYGCNILVKLYRKK